MSNLEPIIVLDLLPELERKLILPGNIPKGGITNNKSESRSISPGLPEEIFMRLF
jgi:hypothetical protein